VDDLLQVRRVTVELPTAAGWVKPVNEVSLRIASGETLGLVGESGSGKTMLSLTLMGLLPPAARVSGEIWLRSSDAKEEVEARNLVGQSEDEWRRVRGLEIAMIFQEPMTSLNPGMRIGQQIEEAILAHEPNVHGEALHRRLLTAMERAALPNRKFTRNSFRFNFRGACGSAP
jgi:ABC-type glutathione transport system ATPase component